MCAFCNDPELKSRIIYQDDLVIAFPTNIPIVYGHILICPVRHLSKIEDLIDEELLAIKKLVVDLQNSLKISLKAEGFNIAWNEGLAAGQSVEHLHIHLVPRKAGDTGIYNYEPRQFLYRTENRELSSSEQLKSIAELLKNNLTAEKADS